MLRGAGGHFCAGADLRDMAGARMQLADDPEALVKVNAAFGDLCVAYASTGLATVAVLEGTVMGGGLGLACVVDVALAGSGAVFRLPETSLGVVPAQIAPFLVERLGYAEAKRLAVTGGRLDSQAALTLRLVHAVHAAGALDHALAAVLAEILQCAPGAVAATKALMAQARFHAAGVDGAPRRRSVLAGRAGPRRARRHDRLPGEAQGELGAAVSVPSQDPGRQPRRDRLPRHAHGAPPGLPHGGGVQRCRRRRAACAAGRRGGAHRRGAGGAIPT